MGSVLEPNKDARSVTIALSLVLLGIKFLQLPAQSPIGSPGTLVSALRVDLNPSKKKSTRFYVLMMMIAFITIKVSLVPLIEGLVAQI